MNIYIKNTNCLFILLILSLISLAATVMAKTTEDNLTIIFTSGQAEIYLDHNQGGYAHLQTFLKKARKADDHVLFIHGGDVLSPGILSTIDKGAHIISILNDLEPDMMAVSKRDLAHQEDELSLRSFEAAFPIINCNIYDPLTGTQPEGLFPYFLKKVGTINIGFISVVDPEVITDYIPRRISTIDMNKAVSDNASKLREQGADIVILVADLNLDSFNKRLSNPPVDVVLLSKTNGKTGLTQQGNSLFELKGNKGMASVITLNFSKNDNKIVWTGAGKTISLIDYKPDIAVKSKIDSYLSQLSGVLDQVIGMTRTAIDTRRESIRSRENGFANLTTDALRAYYKSDIALINGGGFPANRQYPAGSSITVGDIQKELPFNNRVVNVRVTGDILRKSLERGLSRIEELKGCFPHISGIRVTYNPDKPPLQRIVSITIDGKPLDPDKSYTLTTIDYLANGGDGYLELKHAERIVKIDKRQLLWEYIRHYIEEQGAISPKIDGRLKAVNQQ